MMPYQPRFVQFHSFPARIYTFAFVVALAISYASATATPTVATVTILAVNDVYRIKGVDAGRYGGLARLRTVREDLEEKAPELLVLLAGDFLFPSPLSLTYDGAQMIDVLNLLDGDAKAFDPRFFVVFGNHEFQKSALSDAAILDARIEESDFTWLGTNVEFVIGDDGQPLAEAENLVPTALVDIGGVKVGIFGITTDINHPEYVRRFGNPTETARQAVRKLRDAGAEIVIALTHQAVTQDRAMIEALGADKPDVIVGGHEHVKTVAEIAGVPILKADAEARTATLIELSVPTGGGKAAVDYRFLTLDEAVAKDPAVAARIEHWFERHDHDLCAAESTDCLGEKLAVTHTELVAEKVEIRRFETNLGNWIADLALAAYRDQGAQIAVINSGSIRLNQNVPTDAWITRWRIEEMFPYPGDLELLAIDGATLQQMLNHAVSDWTEAGWWLQIAGFAYRHDPVAGIATDLTLLTDAGSRPICPGDRLLIVVPSYLVDPSSNQDGYTMLDPRQRVPDTPRHDLKQLVIGALRKAGEAGIAPKLEGRICNLQRPGPCLTMK